MEEVPLERAEGRALAPCGGPPSAGPGSVISYFASSVIQPTVNPPAVLSSSPQVPLIRREGMQGLAGCLLTGPGLHGPGSWRGSAGRSSLSLRMSCRSGSQFLPRCSPSCSPRHSPQRTKQTRRGCSLKATIETLAIAVACLAGAPQPGTADMFSWTALPRGCGPWSCLAHPGLARWMPVTGACLQP